MSDLRKVTPMERREILIRLRPRVLARARQIAQLERG